MTSSAPSAVPCNAPSGGPRAATLDPHDIFACPIIDREIEQAVLAVVLRAAMAGLDHSIMFEHELAACWGRRHAPAHNTGTGAIEAATRPCGDGVNRARYGAERGAAVRYAQAFERSEHGAGYDEAAAQAPFPAEASG